MTEQTPPEGFVPDRRELSAEALADLKRHFRAKIQADDQAMTAAPEPMAEKERRLLEIKAQHAREVGTNWEDGLVHQERDFLLSYIDALTASTASAVESEREQCCSDFCLYCRHGAEFDGKMHIVIRNNQRVARPCYAMAIRSSDRARQPATGAKPEKKIRTGWAADDGGEDY